MQKVVNGGESASFLPLLCMLQIDTSQGDSISISIFPSSHFLWLLVVACLSWCGWSPGAMVGNGDHYPPYVIGNGWPAATPLPSPEKSVTIQLARSELNASSGQNISHNNTGQQLSPDSDSWPHIWHGHQRFCLVRHGRQAGQRISKNKPKWVSVQMFTTMLGHFMHTLCHNFLFLYSLFGGKNI